jgi:hypothetical protein
VISDAHRGLVSAIGAAVPGAAWQRCRTHYLRNWSRRVPKTAQPWVATLVRTLFDQPDGATVTAQFDGAWTPSPPSFPAPATTSTRPAPICRRTDVVGILLNRAAIIRLFGAVLAEQTNVWCEGRRYMGLDILHEARLTSIDPERANAETTRRPQSPHKINTFGSALATSHTTPADATSACARLHHRVPARRPSAPGSSSSAAKGGPMSSEDERPGGAETRSDEAQRLEENCLWQCLRQADLARRRTGSLMGVGPMPYSPLRTTRAQQERLQCDRRASHSTENMRNGSSALRACRSWYRAPGFTVMSCHRSGQPCSAR